MHAQISKTTQLTLRLASLSAAASPQGRLLLRKHCSCAQAVLSLLRAMTWVLLGEGLIITWADPGTLPDHTWRMAHHCSEDRQTPQKGTGYKEDGFLKRSSEEQIVGRIWQRHHLHSVLPKGHKSSNPHIQVFGLTKKAGPEGQLGLVFTIYVELLSCNTS